MRSAAFKSTKVRADLYDLRAGMERNIVAWSQMLAQCLSDLFWEQWMRAMAAERTVGIPLARTQPIPELTTSKPDLQRTILGRNLRSSTPGSLEWKKVTL